MKKVFTKGYILANSGCYKQENKNPALSFDSFSKSEITLEDLSKEKNLPFKDFAWFFVNGCELSVLEKQIFALFCAKSVLFIYEKKYPKDKRVKGCIDATERYLKGQATEEELQTARAAAAYAADAAVDAAAYAAAYAADAADAYAAYAADAAADAVDAAEVKKQIVNYILAHE